MGICGSKRKDNHNLLHTDTSYSKALHCNGSGSACGKDKDSKLTAKLPWQLLFTAVGSLVFVLSPTVMARSFYHPALAGQWLILLGFLLILDTPKFKKIWSLTAVWAVVLTMTVLIHPYFLPMMGVLMVISEIRCWSRLDGKVWQKSVSNLG